MIDINKFQSIRETNHLIVLDTNILLELYRQPANISLDIISILKEVKDKIYIPKQVYDEYIRNYKKICGEEKKKNQKVKKELSQSAKKLQDEIDSKMNGYRKHNYTDISKLQTDLYQKIEEIQGILNNFEQSHRSEIQLNRDFLEKDKVKELVDLLETEGKVGTDILFSEKLKILQEGQLRFDNLIPPGYADSQKEGIDKYGDLFVWKSMIAIAKEKSFNIIFVCNDTKEDWWEKDDDVPIDLRNELLMEFKEVNPLLDVHFLTLDKFFGYLAEELQVAKSKSALQLSAKEDVKDFLKVCEDYIEKKITEILVNIDIEEELGEEFLEAGEECIFWSVEDVTVDKEDKNIIYYIKLDVSILADLSYVEPGNYPCYAGKIALALVGKGKYVIEEYSSEGTLQELDIELEDKIHIEPEDWQTIRQIHGNESCKVLINAVRGLESYANTIREISSNTVELKNFSGVAYTLQEMAQRTKQMQNVEALSQIVKAVTPLKENVQMVSSLKEMAKVAEPIQKIAQTTPSLHEMAKTMQPLSQIAKYYKK